ncbi:MAG: sterol desaturase family protein [Rhodospirillales bacterium]
MMPEYQRRFREEFHAQNSPWYNGYVNLAYIYVTWLMSLWIFIQCITGPVLWWEWVGLALAFLACMFFEWFVHRYFMHRLIGKNPAAQILYWGHNHHHMFFTDQEMGWESHKDWRTMFLPPYAQLACVTMAVVPAVVLGFAVSENLAWLFMCSVVTTYVYFESIHMFSHMDNKFVRVCPVINTIRRAHRPHHIPRHRAHLNLNVTISIFDWLMGTSDLNSGLVGHLSNGVSGKHVRKDLAAEYEKLWGPEYAVSAEPAE